MRQILVGFIALVAGCSTTEIPGPADEPPVQPPSAPSTPPSAPPVQPPAPPPQESGSFIISGIVFDHTSEGPRPAANLPLIVRTGGGLAATTTDESGRYSVVGFPGPVSIAPAPGSGYYAPCPAGWDYVDSSSRFEVHVVSATLLSTSGAPSDMPLNSSIWVSGIVFEKTAEGRRPVAGAAVHMDGDGTDLRMGSHTLTNAEGRYLLCPMLPSTGTDMRTTLIATREGYAAASATAFLGWDYDGVDIMLRRE